MIMRTGKKSAKLSLVIVLIFAMVLGMAACGNKSNESGTTGSGSIASGEKNMDEILLAAAENIKNAKSMTSKMVMDMGMEVFGTPFDTTMTMDIKTINSPMAMEAVGTMDMGDMGKMDMKIFGEEENGKLTMYSGVGDETEGLTWVKEAVDVNSSQVNQYNAQYSIDLYMDSANSFKEVGTEDVNGVKAVRYDGTISGDDIAKVVENSGMEEQVGSEVTADMFKDAGDITVSFWVDTEKELIVKYEMDMSDVMQHIMEQAVASAAEGEEGDMTSLLSITSVVISMEITGIDNVDSITVPDDAKANAQTVDEL